MLRVKQSQKLVGPGFVGSSSRAPLRRFPKTSSAATEMDLLVSCMGSGKQSVTTRRSKTPSIIIGLAANAVRLSTPLGIIIAVDMGLREAYALLLVGHPAGISSAFSIVGILSPVTSRIVELSAFSAGVELREGITIQTDPSGLGCADTLMVLQEPH